MNASSIFAHSKSQQLVRVHVHLSEDEQRRFLQNVHALTCSKTDYVRFVIRCACADKINLRAFCKCTFKTNEKRNVNNVVRAERHLLDAIQTRADALGVSRATLIRALVTMPIELVEDDATADFEILRVEEIKNELLSLRSEVLRIGQNCNQIAHAMNVCKNRNWLPADHAEPIFGGANDSLNKIDHSLVNISNALTDGIAQLSSIDEKIYPLPVSNRK